MMDWVHFKRLNLFSRNQNLRTFPAKKNGDGNDKVRPHSVARIVGYVSGLGYVGVDGNHPVIGGAIIGLNVVHSSL